VPYPDARCQVWGVAGFSVSATKKIYVFWHHIHMIQYHAPVKPSCRSGAKAVEWIEPSAKVAGADSELTVDMHGKDAYTSLLLNVCVSSWSA
jgi:hypothetical protein